MSFQSLASSKEVWAGRNHQVMVNYDSGTGAPSKRSETAASAALSTFLRNMRSRTKPESVGILPVGSRRVPGLRREELAKLADVGIAWYTWLEQGRGVRVSSDVLERLSAVMSLSPTERMHLFTLAHNRPPPNGEWQDYQVSKASTLLLGRISDAAYVANRRWDILAWNYAASQLFTDLSRHSRGVPNMMRLLFTSLEMRDLHSDWPTAARETLEKFRVDYWEHQTEPSFPELVKELQDTSQEFRLWWSDTSVHAVRSGLKSFRSPAGGFIDYRYSVLNLSDVRTQRLVVFMSTASGCLAEGVTCACPVATPDLESRQGVISTSDSANE